MKRIGAHVRYEAVEGVGWITLARPQVLNALDPLLASELAAAVDAARTDADAWVVAVTGEGRAFSSGMDRKALSAGTIGESFFRDWIRALNGLEDMDKLVLAVIRGYCIGGGLQLALACDLRLCAADAVLGLGATRHGLIPDGAVLIAKPHDGVGVSLRQARNLHELRVIRQVHPDLRHDRDLLRGHLRSMVCTSVHRPATRATRWTDRGRGPRPSQAGRDYSMLTKCACSPGSLSSVPLRISDWSSTPIASMRWKC